MAQGRIYQIVAQIIIIIQVVIIKGTIITLITKIIIIILIMVIYKITQVKLKLNDNYCINDSKRQ